MKPRCVRGESVHGMNRTELTSIAPSCSTPPPPRNLLTAAVLILLALLLASRHLRYWH